MDIASFDTILWLIKDIVNTILALLQDKDNV